VVQAILFFLLGATMTIAVAWGCAIMTSRIPEERTFVGPTGLLTIQPEKREKVYFGEGEWHSVLRFSTVFGDVVRLDFTGGDPVHDPHIAPADLPLWTSVHRRPRQTYEAITLARSLHEEAWGWPLRALYSRTWLADDPTGLPDNVESSNGVVIRNQVATAGFLTGGRNVRITTGRDVRILPLAPVWSGLIGNSAAFAAAWWMLLVGFSRARSLMRTRRGRCPKCAYDLRGDLRAGCPECGWNRGDSKQRDASATGSSLRLPNRIGGTVEPPGVTRADHST
jgi:hypothetical protein